VSSRTRFGVLGALTFAAAGAFAQVTQQGNVYLFRLHLTQGEKLNFRVPFSISGVGDTPMNLHFAMKLRVEKVTRTGTATIHAKIDSGTFALPGIDPKGGSFVVDNRGRVGDTGTSPVGFCVVYPRDPIAVGGTFVAPVASTMGGAGASTQATFKFIGFSGVGIHRVARFTFKVAGNKAPGGSVLVRTSDGVIEKYFTTFIAITSATDKPVSVTATFIRM